MNATLPVFRAPLKCPGNERFWEATDRGELLIKRCGACGEPHSYPRPFCSFFRSDDTRWEAASGRGTIDTSTVIRKWEFPAAIGFVELEEGPRILTLIVDANPNRVAIGQHVYARRAPAERDFSVVVFAPIK